MLEEMTDKSQTQRGSFFGLRKKDGVVLDTPVGGDDKQKQDTVWEFFNCVK